MESVELRKRIVEVVSQHAKLAVDAGSLDDDADLFAAGMTSLASVNVMLGLEDAFDVEFPDEMLTRSIFVSIHSMATAIESLIVSRT